MIFQCILWFSLYKVLKLVKLVQVALHTRVSAADTQQWAPQAGFWHPGLAGQARIPSVDKASTGGARWALQAATEGSVEQSRRWWVRSVPGPPLPSASCPQDGGEGSPSPDRAHLDPSCPMWCDTGRSCPGQEASNLGR